jgi:ABC-type bacteriocin/lantibiotic exporter with double-glycine peptidase domain
MPGEKVGIIGRSGSGKSSLIKVLWRALVPFEGKVLIDGVDISKRDLKDFRR